MARLENTPFACGMDTSKLLERLTAEAGSVTLSVPVDQEDSILLKSKEPYGHAEIVVATEVGSVTVHRQDGKLMNFVRADGREGPEQVLPRAVGNIAIQLDGDRWCLPPDAEQPADSTARINLDLLWSLVAGFAVARRESNKRRNTPPQNL